jgi:hypothetical protein
MRYSFFLHLIHESETRSLFLPHFRGVSVTMTAGRVVRVRLELTVLTLAFFSELLGIVQGLLPTDSLHGPVVKQSNVHNNRRLRGWLTSTATNPRRRTTSHLFLTSSSLAASAPSVISAETLLDNMVPSDEQHASVSFSHVHLYADRVEDLQVYKALELDLNNFAEARAACTSTLSLDEQRELWQSMTHHHQPSEAFVSHGRDVVKQLMAGLGFRVTAARYSTATRTVLVTSQDADGVQILVTALSEPAGATEEASGQEEDSFFFDAGTLFNSYNDGSDIWFPDPHLK